ncbi:MAG: alpha/beta hydrolase-fold protein [Alistipes sp.]|nr:alpha/beta hydrolase-fold protein [Alistipes senegalensis]MCM1250612.1 alpha/beta hydrolase-fold protein [Alistipes sp.]
MMNLFCAGLLALGLAAAGGCGDKERELPPVPGTFVRYADEIPVQSDILRQSVSIAVLLPADYVASPDRRYGVVYLLHGLGDTHKSWNDQWLRIEQTVAQCEAAGLDDMIYVMPTGFRSYYVDRVDGNFDYMKMFVEELVPYVDRTYRTIADRDHRAAVGYSMGGFGAMILPSCHPELFCVSVPLSMSFRTDEQYMSEPASGWDSQWGAIFGGRGMAGEARLTDYYKAHCPFYMFTPENGAKYADVAYYLDCGDDEEQLLVANDDLHRQLRDNGFAHEYRVRNGAHTGDYWRGAMPEVLRFIDCRFRGRPFEAPARTSYAAHGATYRTAEWAGVSADVFLPEDARPTTVLYLLHDGKMALSPDEVLDVLAPTLQAKPFAMVAADASADDFALEAFLAAAEAELSMGGDRGHRICLAAGDAGKAAFAATVADSPFGSLFLLDAAVDGAPNPSSEVFYYIALTDEGRHYASANDLYKACHAAGVGFEYRVVDGTPTDASAAERCIEAMRSKIGEKITLK